MVAEYTGGQITRYRLEDDDPNTPLNEFEVTQESHYYPFGMNQDGPCLVRRSLTGVGGVCSGGSGE